MKLMNKALIVLAAVSLFGITGCKKNQEEAPKVEETVQTQEALTVLDWSKGSANSLLVNVPADTMGAFASTRSMDLDDPMLKAMLENNLKTFDASIQATEKEIQEMPADSADTKRLKALSDLNKNFIRPLIADFANVAPTWGFDPKGHQDSVVYMNGNTMVAQMTVNSVSKLEAKLNEVMDEFGKADAALKIVPRDVKAGDSNWKVYSIKPFVDGSHGKCVFCDSEKKTHLPTELAIHYGKNGVVTMALVDENDTATLEKVLKPAAAALSADALGKKTGATAGLGFIDLPKVYQAISSPAGIALAKASDVDEEDLTPECIKDYGALVALFPKVTFATDINSATQIVSRSTLVLANKDELKKLDGLHAQSLDVIKDSDLASVAVNIDLVKTLEYVKGLAASATTMNLTCAGLTSIVPELEGMVQTLSNPLIAGMAGAISGINIGLSKLNLEAKNADGESAPEIDAVINISGATLAAKLPLILTMLKGTEFKEIVDMVNLILPPKGEVKEIDLKEMLNFPIKINSFMSDTDLLFGTQAYDIKAISTSAKKDHKDFIGVAFNMSLLALAGLEISPELLKASYGMTLGTNDEGITFNVVINN